MPAQARQYFDADEDWLLLQARSQDPVAVAELYSRYRFYTRALAMDTGIGRADVEDLAAEAWTRILTTFAAGGGPSRNFRAYLIRTVHNTAVDLWRKQHRMVLTDDLDNAADSASDPGYSGDLVSDAYDALISLSQAQRQLLTDSFADGYSHALLALRAGITRNALDNRLSRARAALRRAYDAQHGAA